MQNLSSKIAGYKIKTQKLFAFPYTYNEHFKKEIKEKKSICSSIKKE